MKLFLQLLFTSFLSGFLIVSCDTEDTIADQEEVPHEKDIPVASVTLNQKSAELEIGGTIKLTASVSPSDATRTAITWSSSMPTVATVSATGEVTAIAEGETTVTASADGKEDHCQILVRASMVPVSGIRLSVESMTLTLGEERTIEVTITPENATDKTVIWSSSNSSVASVEGGLVTALAEGNATITATAGDQSASCEVSVQKKYIPVTSISLDYSSMSLEEGDTALLTATVLPEDADDRTVSWSSSNPSVATVEGGLVTALAEGMATITATAGDQSASCEVSVQKKYIPVSSVTLDYSSLSLEEGETAFLTATVLPEDANDRAVNWSSSNPSVASVEGGLVTALAEGNATITATAGDQSASCEVSVQKKYIPVTSISLDYSSMSLEEGDTALLTATVLPEDADDRTVSWSSSNPSVATVEGGLVTALAEGMATITATAGDQSATCMVNVSKAPVILLGITFNVTQLQMEQGQQYSLTVLPVPSDAALEGTLEWSSSDSSIVTVSSDGRLLAVNAGKATVTATFGSFTATCAVSVKGKDGDLEGTGFEDWD